MPELLKTTSRTSSSSALLPAAAASAGQNADSASVRPRNRRLVSSPTGGKANDGFEDNNSSFRYGNATSAASTSLLPSSSRSSSRGASPLPITRIGLVTGQKESGGTKTASRGDRARSPGLGSGLLGGSWASLQDLATTLLSGASSSGHNNRDETSERDRRSRSAPRWGSDVIGSSSRKSQDVWGPEPPRTSRPKLDDVAAGSRAERQATLRALRTARVLESQDDSGNGGGKDASGNFKKRRSDDDLRASAEAEESEENLVYIHHVRPEDTYAGIVLKYRCREDAFRKANGLWSRDGVQMRKWLALPVDACEVRGRPCEGPTPSGGEVDLLAPTPDATEPVNGDHRGASAHQDGFFSLVTDRRSLGDEPKAEEQGAPWTHVRWVSIDTFANPVEVARMPRKALGYFPPRRRTLRSNSTFSTPRGSLDVPSIALGSDVIESPPSTSSRRPSLLSGARPVAQGYSSSTPGASRSRVGSGGDDLRPAWMRHPGGVGSLGKNARAPGPDRDYLNAWAKKHLPGLNIDSLPSMSVMGSEIARFGITPDEQAAIVESPFEDGRDLASSSRQGSGLDKAAAAIETWLRGAFAKRPGTPNLGSRGRPAQREGDLIELADTNSDDGRAGTSSEGAGFAELNLLGSPALGSSSRSGYSGSGTVRGRTTRTNSSNMNDNSVKANKVD
ncbi:hypothetical protein VTK73DRAFT_7086 [Phialemonium thermophilum]|uniref:LysM domain-containing protein n=1 Tax=Phialemonium thermophilum TaxID=223376 RepID=A0ABR3XTP2_9PEZI